jgi:hypothetical protein
VGKGASAPCPPSSHKHALVGTLSLCPPYDLAPSSSPRNGFAVITGGAASWPRLEGWMQHADSRPSFETAALRPPQDEDRNPCCPEDRMRGVHQDSLSDAATAVMSSSCPCLRLPPPLPMPHRRAPAVAGCGAIAVARSTGRLRRPRRRKRPGSSAHVSRLAPATSPRRRGS